LLVSPCSIMLVKTLLPFVVAALAVSAAPLATADKAHKSHGKAPAKNASGPHLPVQPPLKVAVGPRADNEANVAAAGTKGKGGKGGKKFKQPKPVTHVESIGPVSPPSPAGAPQIVNHVSRDEDDNDNDNDDDNDGSSEAEAAKSKQEKQAPFPFNMAPAPAQHAVKMVPRQSKPDVPPKPEESSAPVHPPVSPPVNPPVNPFAMAPRDSEPAPAHEKSTTPSVPPEQAVAAKDMVLSHVPRADMPPVPPEQAVAAKDMVLSHAPRAANKKHHQKAVKQTPQSPAAKVAETVMEKPKMVAGSV